MIRRNTARYCDNSQKLFTQLFESLLSNWKKLHLDWHVRLLKIYKPTKGELLRNQSILLSIFGTGHSSLMNYAMQSIKKIYGDEDFDRVSFVENFPIMFSNEKVGKSLIVGLDILESFLSNSMPTEIEYREELSVLLMQADTKVQEKTAQMLVDYYSDEHLEEVVEPYINYLKQKSKDILGLSNKLKESIFDTYTPQIYPPIKIITNWDELLLHLLIIKSS